MPLNPNPDVISMTQFKRIYGTDDGFSLSPNPVAINKTGLEVMERFHFLASLPLASTRGRDVRYHNLSITSYPHLFT